MVFVVVLQDLPRLEPQLAHHPRGDVLEVRGMTRLAYSVKDAAQAAGVSENFVRACIRSPGGEGYPPPLVAKFIGGRAGYRIQHKQLEAWIEGWKDA